MAEFEHALVVNVDKNVLFMGIHKTPLSIQERTHCNQGFLHDVQHQSIINNPLKTFEEDSQCPDSMFQSFFQWAYNSKVDSIEFNPKTSTIVKSAVATTDINNTWRSQ
jgi:hypothetical protein